MSKDAVFYRLQENKCGRERKLENFQTVTSLFLFKIMNFQLDRPNYMQMNIERTLESKSKTIFLLTIWNYLYH